MNALQPKLDTLDAWAEPLIAKALAERGADPADYAREVRGDEGGYTVILTHRDAPAGGRGSAEGKPSYEIVLDRRAKTLTRVSVAR